MHSSLHCNSLSPWGQTHTSAPSGERAQSFHTWQHTGGSWGGLPAYAATLGNHRVTPQVYLSVHSRATQTTFNISDHTLTVSHACTLSWWSSTNHVTSSTLPLMAAWCNSVRPFCGGSTYTQYLYDISCMYVTNLASQLHQIHEWRCIVCSPHFSPSGHNDACLQGAWPRPCVHTQRQQ